MNLPFYPSKSSNFYFSYFAKVKDVTIRNNAFHTRCTFHGKVCKVIIDSVSFENLVSTKMVQKLGLEIISHPNPYQLCWLQGEIEIKISKRCLVSFSLANNYKNEVSYDIVPMNVCHLLLDRSWLYDKRVLCDGFKYTYSFMINGKKDYFDSFKTCFGFQTF